MFLLHGSHLGKSLYMYMQQMSNQICFVLKALPTDINCTVMEDAASWLFFFFPELCAGVEAHWHNSEKETARQTEWSSSSQCNVWI